MADVTSRERAQLVLVAGLVLAATMVGIALVLNTVLFTENLATRQTTFDTTEAVKYEQAGTTNARSILQGANYASDTDGYTDRHQNFSTEMSWWASTTTRYQVASAQSNSVSIENYTDGTRISQDSADEFHPANWSTLSTQDILGTPQTHTSWAVASDATLRKFRMHVERDSLTSDTQTNVSAIVDGSRDDDVFWVQIEEGGDTWKVAVYEDTSSPSNVTVLVDDGGATDETCSAEATGDGNVSVNLTAGHLEGADGRVDCEALSFFDGLADYDVYYVDGGHVRGTYGLVADQSVSTYESELNDQLDDDLGDLGLLAGSITFDDTYYANPSNGDPYFTTAIYAVEVELVYQTDEVRYRSDVRVAPGEPEGVAP